MLSYLDTLEGMSTSTPGVGMNIHIKTLIMPVLEEQKQNTRPQSSIQARSNSIWQELRF